jgi:hypothetical protein
MGKILSYIRGRSLFGEQQGEDEIRGLKIRNDQNHNLYCPPDVVGKVFKSGRMRRENMQHPWERWGRHIEI